MNSIAPAPRPFKFATQWTIMVLSFGLCGILALVYSILCVKIMLGTRKAWLLIICLLLLISQGAWCACQFYISQDNYHNKPENTSDRQQPDGNDWILSTWFDSLAVASYMLAHWIFAYYYFECSKRLSELILGASCDETSNSTFSAN